VGTHVEALNTSFLVNELNWIAIESISRPIEVKAKIRSAQKETGVMVEPIEDDLVKVTFAEPMEGITPGQSAVFYQDDLVIGGGVIKEVLAQTTVNT
jgi:tRNA-specific 2-thiouridylase